MASSALLHPVRLRIIQTLLADGDLTPHQLHAHLVDVPIATLYRHVNHLASHGLIEVAQERQVRGTSEKTYRVTPGMANPTPQDLGSLSREELMTVFTVFTTGLIGDFSAYIRDGDRPDLTEDRVNFTQASFWATQAEVDTFLDTVSQALQNLLGNQPGGDRRRRTLTTVLIPRPDGEQSD
ncbi:DNA-binding protein [Actinomyces oris]|jgi:hypothetical protein|uniref:helix-turn-helix domain-containing protein n=1 Tax=Actinomyces TaxID=1654 RepID=UPI00094CEFCA|nr:MULTISPECIES: helix-turn-helix domain-containing protein [Actinomyces]OLO60204.1 DNA-binding protein [Actinomyces oris]OLO69920.1 DNA-binding protein [Actinomyces oris]